MIHLRRDPDGDTVMEPTSTSGTYISDTTDHTKEIASLRQQISELKERLAQVTVNIALINFHFYHCYY